MDTKVAGWMAVHRAGILGVENPPRQILDKGWLLLAYIVSTFSYILGNSDFNMYVQWRTSVWIKRMGWNNSKLQQTKMLDIDQDYPHALGHATQAESLQSDMTHSQKCCVSWRQKIALYLHQNTGFRKLLASTPSPKAFYDNILRGSKQCIQRSTFISK